MPWKKLFIYQQANTNNWRVLINLSGLFIELTLAIWLPSFRRRLYIVILSTYLILRRGNILPKTRPKWEFHHSIRGFFLHQRWPPPVIVDKYLHHVLMKESSWQLEAMCQAMPSPEYLKGYHREWRYCKLILHFTDGKYTPRPRRLI